MTATKTRQDAERHDGEFERSISIRVANSMVAAALTATAVELGWEVAADRISLAQVAVVDLQGAASIDHCCGIEIVMVCEPNPFEASLALDAFGKNSIRAVISADEPEDLVIALRALDHDRATVPTRLVDLGSAMPTLSPRQLAIIRALLSGQSNADLGAELFLSVASVKRELGIIYAAMSVCSRHQLVARALELGITPQPLCAELTVNPAP